MSPQKHASDAMLERELERLMSVEPSADFQARVRTRVVRETIAAPGDVVRGWLGWRALALVAACIVLAVVVMRWTTPRAASNPQARVTPGLGEAQPSTIGQVEPAPSEPALSQPPLSADRPTPPLTVNAAPRVKADPIVDATGPVVAVQTKKPDDPFADVLVSASELKALRQVEALLAGRELKEEDAPKTAAARDDTTELVITPIAIEPIQIAAIKGDAE